MPLPISLGRHEPDGYPDLRINAVHGTHVPEKEPYSASEADNASILRRRGADARAIFNGLPVIVAHVKEALLSRTNSDRTANMQLSFAIGSALGSLQCDV